MAVTGGVTKDGRCFRCVQRKRWITGPLQLSDATPPRHLLLDGDPICLLPKAEPWRGDVEQRRRYNRVWRRKRLEQDPDYREVLRMRGRESHFRRTYGITVDQYDQMLTAQEGDCAVCSVNEATCVDHDHRTGKVRALVCHPCNLMLGHAEDDEVVLLAAIEYLRKHRATT